MNAKQRWYMGLYAAPVVLLALGVWTLIAGSWVAAIAYLVSALNCWVAASHVVTQYRAGYWRGRAETYAEVTGARPVRPVGTPEVNPWDDQSGLTRELNEFVQRLRNEHDR